MRLKASRAFRYAGRRLSAGDEFDTKTERDGVLLVAARSATAVDPAPKARRGRPPKVARVEVQLETAETVADDVAAGRFYVRRDMEAE